MKFELGKNKNKKSNTDKKNMKILKIAQTYVN